MIKAKFKLFNRTFLVKNGNNSLIVQDIPPDKKEVLISIVIPLYNEEDSIINVLNRIPNHYIHEIIIVDDGSTDNSVNEIKKIKDKNIIIIEHEINRGYGTALKTGIMRSNGDIIVTMDSDGQHDPQEIPKLIKPIIDMKAELCIGSRYIGNSEYVIPLHTRMGEFCISFILWLLFNQKVGNNQSGFRAFRKEAIPYFNNIKNDGMGFTTELLCEFAYQGKKIIEIPINLNKRKFGTSNVKLINVTRSIISCIMKYFLREMHINEKIIRTMEIFFLDITI